jgi:Hypoxia induced protein conserved region
MHDVFDLLIPLALAAVATTLGFGIYTLFRGGEFGLKWSNKLMRLRVALQAVAILILVAAIMWRGRH